MPLMPMMVTRRTAMMMVVDDTMPPPERWWWLQCYVRRHAAPLSPAHRCDAEGNHLARLGFRLTVSLSVSRPADAAARNML